MQVCFPDIIKDTCFVMKKLFVLISICFPLVVHAQHGKIRGTIFDGKTGESMVGVNLVVKGTTMGTTTDLDGRYSLDIEEGTYDLQVLYISYQPMTIEAVKVKADEVTLLDDIRLEESPLTIDEVVVRAEAIRSTETALQTIKRNSTVILDGISSSRMDLIGDATAVEAAKRITGVSIEDGKYIYVRGLGDRYTKTTMNGMDIPGLDPDRNSLQMDIFPTNLLSNMLVSKNFNVNLPADFTGGIMNVETQDFPDKHIFTASFGSSFNPAMHFNRNYLSYEGGKTDFLGFDDGTRALPDGADQENIPTPISGHSTQDVNAFIRSFNPELGTVQHTSLMDFSANLSLGNQIDLGGKEESRAGNPKLGYIFSLSYKSNYRYFDDVVYGEYQRYQDPDYNEIRYATIQNGRVGERNFLAGVLGGLAYKTNFSKIRLTAMHLQNGESRAARINIDNDGQAVGQSGYIAVSDNLEYNQRSLSNVFLGGTHLLQAGGWEIDWGVSSTYSTSIDPDIRKTAFTKTGQGLQFIAGAGGNPTRIWRYLHEMNAQAKVDVTKEYQFNGSEARLRFGTSHAFKYRNYEILYFDMQFFGSIVTWPNPTNANTVLDPGHIYPNQPERIYYSSGNSDPNPNQYSSNVNNTGFYVSNEFNITPKFKTTLGVRAENYVQRHTGRDQSYASGDIVNGRNLDNEKVLESLDFFPSVNLIYSFTSLQNLRLSYARTIARPSFKELSFAQILDPLSNRIFNGSLFTYPGWDGNLQETHINNMDLRWELFFLGGQIVSVSAFYKDFDKPIELVRIPEQQTSTEYQPRNVGDGSLFGLELELRKNLDFISPFFGRFNLNSNLTVVRSHIEMTDLEYNSRKGFEKVGEHIENSRVMAGQAPYMVNSGLIYSVPEQGLEAGLFYNVKGKTLYIVGAGLFPDIFIKPFHSLNLSVNKSLGIRNRLLLEFKASNLLDNKIDQVYSAFRAEDQPYYQASPGQEFSLGLKYRID